jgi:hypothetical protein
VIEVPARAEGNIIRMRSSWPMAVRPKNAKSVRMRYTRGVLGFDYLSEFEPVSRERA